MVAHGLMWTGQGGGLYHISLMVASDSPDLTCCWQYHTVMAPITNILTNSGWTLTNLMRAQANSILHMSTLHILPPILGDGEGCNDVQSARYHICTAQKYKRINVLESKHLTNEKWELTDINSPSFLPWKDWLKKQLYLWCLRMSREIR